MFFGCIKRYYILYTYNCVTTYYAFEERHSDRHGKSHGGQVFCWPERLEKRSVTFSVRWDVVITTWWHVLLGEVWRTWIMKSSGNRSCKTFPLDLMFSCFAFCNTFRIYHLKSSWSIYFEMGILKFITPSFCRQLYLERPIPPIETLRRTMPLWFVDLERRGSRQVETEIVNKNPSDPCTVYLPTFIYHKF